ncbi:MAG: ABC transporter permease [Thermoguttaceae bacterium]|jgi:molybdate transport system permease protein
MSAPREHTAPRRPPDPDLPFYCALGGLSATYVVLILAVLAALALFRPPDAPRDYLLWLMLDVLRSPEIRYSTGLSLVSCTVTTLVSLLVAVPTGYLLSRRRFPGRGLIDAVFDIPIVLPPLVIGLGLLILFQTPAGRAFQRVVPVTYEIPSVILAQFTVACAFAVRTMQVTFSQINPRQEQVALTLGCSRAQAFFRVALPEARRGVLTAATLAWARALGEFGPILVFSGATRFRTEVLPTSVFLELSIGNIEAAVAVSLLMIVIALAVLLVARAFGLRGTGLI